MSHDLSTVDHHHDADATEVFGFWIYILTDCILFATLFAAFAVLHQHTFGGPSLGKLTDLPYVLTETLILLASSFTYGMSMLAMYKEKKGKVMFWLLITAILGIAFVSMELHEFAGLVAEGHSWRASAAMSAFFTLVGTHGLHVTIGIIWMFLLMFQLSIGRLDRTMARRLTYLGLFWHFLDIVWIFVFTIVYLMGVAA